MRLSLSGILDIEGNAPSPSLLFLARLNRFRGADVALDAFGYRLGHAPLPLFRLDELRVRVVREDDHLDGDDGHLREDRARERAALIATDLRLKVRADAVVVERAAQAFDQSRVNRLGRAPALFDDSGVRAFRPVFSAARAVGGVEREAPLRTRARV